MASNERWKKKEGGSERWQMRGRDMERKYWCGTCFIHENEDLSEDITCSKAPIIT